nr:hypothetical protein 8 [Saccharospirillaceae bacterium]
MPITSADIKLMQPERLTDNPDGGGSMTGNPVIDGDINNLFEDISRVNRTYGQTGLRKAFLKVDTDTADLYLDAHAILSAQPQDPNVSGLLFTTDNFTDERVDARQRVESFVVPGPITGLYLRGEQLKGQKSLICYAPTINTAPAPEIGETYLLCIDDDLSTQQFIKILDVEHSVETFTYEVTGGNIRTFKADQYVLSLSAELARNYPAGDPNPKPNDAARVYSTQPAPSAKYYGSTRLAGDVTGGATSLQVTETFAPIIPTASSETPVIDQRPGGYLNQVVATTTDTIGIDVTVAAGGTSELPTAIVPGSISLTVSGTPYTDKGGILVNGSGEPGALDGTAIDYRSGTLVWGGTASGSATLSYRPGTLRQQLPNTGRIDIDETNRNFNYVLSLDPPPARTTFHISYQYLGKWYTLQDDGTGLLVGEGTGQVNYDTGSIVVTLQAQPDAGSVLFYRWTEASLYQEDVANTFNATTPVNLQLGNGDIKASSVSLSWEEGGTAKTATDAASDGTITGDATGTIDYATGRIRLTAVGSPDDGFTVDYTHKSDPVLTETTTIPDNTNQSDITLQSAANIEPGSLNFALKKYLRREVRDDSNVLLGTTWRSQIHAMTDNGNGSIINRRTASVVGTVDYGTGLITISGTDFLNAYTID